VQATRGEHLDRARAASPAFPVRAHQEPAARVFLLTLGAICLDYVLAPALNTLTPAISFGLLLLLILRRKPAPAVTTSLASSHFARRRVPLFFLLHLGIASTVGLSHFVAGLGSLADRTPDVVLALAKYAVLLPTIVLLPRDGWRRFGQLYRAECVAAALALVTLYPYRLFVAAWPWYSQALGHAVYALAHPFVAGLQYSSLSSPLFVGPKLDVAVLFWCSGLQGIKLFQIFFILMLVVDWSVLDRRRTLIGYFAGLAFMLMANVVRITLLVIAGNSFPQLAVRYHVTAGWMFFALALAVYIGLVYGWLVADNKTKAPMGAAALVQHGLGPASR
jgi:exosortase/archaeosortase family protein